MSILARRGGNAQDKKAEPPAMPRAAPPAMADPRTIHPAVQEHAKAVSNLYDENERLHALVQKLRNDIEVKGQVLEDKDRTIDAERARLAASDRLKEAYLRFAQEILTRGEDVCNRIDDVRSQTTKMLDDVRSQMAKVITRAMEVAQNAAPPTEELEREIKAIIANAENSENDQESHANGGSQPSA